jgi:hypothetical protein
MKKQVAVVALSWLLLTPAFAQLGRFRRLLLTAEDPQI